MPSKIKLVVLDVDGTLTDGSFTWNDSGEETKRFHFMDVMGIARATRLGIKFALVTGEDSPVIDRFAAKAGITTIVKGCKNKAAAITALAEEFGVSLDAVCFMGDDINDLSVLKIVGLPTAPLTAHPAVLSIAAFVSTRPAGAGAVRCLIDHLWGDEIILLPPA